jgi:uncharacterized phosphatase
VTHLVLVRHGQTDWNLERRIQGSSDIPLNETGRRQAREAAKLLAREHWDAIVSSPLARARETAEIISAELGLGEVDLVDALQERHYGGAEGLTGPEAEERYAGRVPGREAPEAVIARVHPALVALAQKHPGKAVLIVSHGGVIGTLVRDATDHVWPEPGTLIPNGSHHRFAYRDGEIGLVEFNGRPWSEPMMEVAEDAAAS